jgi:SIR2-like domain
VDDKTEQPRQGSVDPIIEEMAELLSKQKLVPFFGAGLSRAHLGLAAAELARDMATELGAPAETLLSQVSDQYAHSFGEAKFVSYLKGKLVVAELDEAKATTHRLLVSLTPNLVYTTNQDNIFELTAEAYGRRYRRVVTLDELSEAAPGERLLIKFHGDTDVPASLVFGQRSYEARMAGEDHPLDIKLRADLLGKRLLFLGYSFSDENVAKLLDTVQRAFKGELPPSYLIAYEYSEAMEELSKRYGIRVIDPRKLCPDAPNAGAAFERFLKALCDRTLALQVKLGVDNLLSGEHVNPRTATDYEIDAVEKSIDKDSFDVALKAFRAEFDAAMIPNHQQERVTELFRKLTERADPRNYAHIGELRGALFNFRAGPIHVLKATAYLMALCNRRPVTEFFDEMMGIPHFGLPKNGLPLAAAMAVELLRQRGEQITESFRRLATFWFHGWEELEGELRIKTKQMIDAAWQGSGSQYRLLIRAGFAMKDIHDIRADLLNSLPKRLKNPES